MVVMQRVDFAKFGMQLSRETGRPKCHWRSLLDRPCAAFTTADAEASPSEPDREQCPPFLKFLLGNEIR